MPAAGTRQATAASCVTGFVADLIGIGALKSAFGGVEVLELQLADLAQRVDGVVRELRGDQQLRVTREGSVGWLEVP